MKDSPDKLENLGKLEAEIPALTLRGIPAQGIPVLDLGVDTLI